MSWAGRTFSTATPQPSKRRQDRADFGSGPHLHRRKSRSRPGAALRVPEGPGPDLEAHLHPQACKAPRRAVNRASSRPSQAAKGTASTFSPKASWQAAPSPPDLTNGQHSVAARYQLIEIFCVSLTAPCAWPVEPLRPDIPVLPFCNGSIRPHLHRTRHLLPRR